MSKLFIGNLSWNTTTDSLRDAMSQFGNVEDCICMTDRETGRSRGFGFCTFSTPEEAQKAVEAMNNADLDGRNIRVDFAQERQPRRDAPRTGGYGGGY